MQQERIYMAGLYLKLSKDDENKGESVSIGTQRAILTDYCGKHHYAIHKVYIDDGYSGMNFARPGFQELLADVEQGTVNMVITKDLSRLGRDYIMTGYYSEIYFPSKGVHLINLSSRNVKIAISEKGDFSDSKITMLKGGNLKGVSDSNKWSLKGASHGDTLAFQISYEGVKEERKKDAKGRTVTDAKGKPVKMKVKSDISLRRSKFVVSERQSQISILVDDPARDGVKMLSVQLAE